MLTLQQMFDKALNGIRQQGGPAGIIHSHYGSKSCRYRITIDGQLRKCGVGHLIPDHGYDPEFDEIGSISELVDERGSQLRDACAGVFDPYDEATFDLLVCLQDAHDESLSLDPTANTTELFMPRFEAAMKDLADNTPGLTYTPPEGGAA